MTVNRKVTGTSATIPMGLAMGVITSLGTMLAGTIVCSMMIEQELLKWEKSGYAIMVILIISSWLGVATASARVKRRKLMICTTTGITYFLALLVLGALFFGGQYNGVGETALLIICGTILGIMTGTPTKPKRKRRKI